MPWLPHPQLRSLDGMIKQTTDLSYGMRAQAPIVCNSIYSGTSGISPQCHCRAFSDRKRSTLPVVAHGEQTFKTELTKPGQFRRCWTPCSCVPCSKEEVKQIGPYVHVVVSSPSQWTSGTLFLPFFFVAPRSPFPALLAEPAQYAVPAFEFGSGVVDPEWNRRPHQSISAQ